MTAPLSLIITAFAPVLDVTKTLTPELKAVENSVLLLIDLGAGKNRLGGSVLAQVYNQLGDNCPDVDDAKRLKAFLNPFKRSINNKNCSRITTVPMAVCWQLPLKCYLPAVWK